MKCCVAICALVVAFAGCTSDSSDAGTPAGVETAPANPTAVIPNAEVHDAICGHAIAGVGRCGNYVKIDGRYVVLEYPSLGAMEFCEAGTHGAKVEITGEMRDGKFVASTYRRVE